MKAAMLRVVGGAQAVENVTIDQPRPNEVLIRTAATGVCHSDLHFQCGAYPTPLPTVLGHESAGVVEAIGSAVCAVAVGDHVVTCLSSFCGRCEHCLTGHLSLCVSPATRRGEGEPPRLGSAEAPVAQFLNLSGYAERMLVHENSCVAIRRDMPLDRAALIGCAVLTGYGAVVHTAGVRPGESVAVVGCGGIGLMAINAAAIAGAGRIVAVDRVAGKESLAREVGATDFVDGSATDAAKQVRALTGGGAHYAFEAVGSAATAELAFAMIRRGGTAVVIGMIPVGQKVSVNGYEFLAEKKLVGSQMGSNRFPIDVPRLVDLYLDGRLKLDLLVSRRIGLDAVDEAFAEMQRGEIARSVVVFP